LGQKGASPVVPTAPAVVSTEEAASTGTMAAWWNRAKQGLLAITPAFHSKKEVGDISASSSVAANLDGSNPLTGVKGGNIATPLNSFRSFLNMSTLAVIVAFLLGILAFGMSIYLYRRTRDEVEVSATGDPVIDIPATPKK
jgi:hypothetical protein